MTTYAAITNSEVASGAPGTQSLFERLRDNPIAITEKAVGAPVLANGYVVVAMMAANSVDSAQYVDDSIDTAHYAPGSVDQAAIGASAVGQGELKTGTNVSIAGSLASNTDVSIVLTHYCFFPMIHVSDATFMRVTGHETDGASADAPRFGLYNEDGSNPHTYDVDYRYSAA